MQILNFVKIEHVLFKDIETVPSWHTFYDAPENVQKEWIYKFKFRPEAPVLPVLDQENTNGQSAYNMLMEKYNRYFAELWIREVGFHAEFSRIVCISVGFMFQGNFYMKSYTDENEGELLRRYCEDLEAFRQVNPAVKLCAHYGKSFDFPFTAKRLIINRMKLPPNYDTMHLKPWENPNLDTCEIWKSGLPAICMALGIQTPKDDIDGSHVSHVWHIEKDSKRIAIYCEKDVFALLNCFKAMRLEEPLTEDKIVMRE